MGLVSRRYTNRNTRDALHVHCDWVVQKNPSSNYLYSLELCFGEYNEPRKTPPFLFILHEKESGISRLAASFNVSPEQLIIQSLREDPQDVIARVIKPVPTAAPGIM